MGLRCSSGSWNCDCAIRAQSYYISSLIRLFFSFYFFFLHFSCSRWKSFQLLERGVFNSQWKCPLAAALKNNQTGLRHPLSGSPPSCFTFTASSGLFSYIYYQRGACSSSSRLAESNLLKLPLSGNCTRYVRLCVVGPSLQVSGRLSSRPPVGNNKALLCVQGSVYVNCSCVTPHNLKWNLVGLTTPAALMLWCTSHTSDRALKQERQTHIWRCVIHPSSHPSIHPSILLTIVTACPTHRVTEGAGANPSCL